MSFRSFPPNKNLLKDVVLTETFNRYEEKGTGPHYLEAPKDDSTLNSQMLLLICRLLFY